MDIKKYKSIFLEHLKEKITLKEPVNLYEPILYILNLGGKRLRPALTLLSCELFGGNYRDALDAALAIEMFHNFSLVHDDIMDAAPLRRGKETVHKKWNINSGILSGDAMLVMASQLIESYDGLQYKKLNTLFNKTALEVCEGQQHDFDFESRVDVSVEEYLKMITLKTAVLLATSLKFGALIAEAKKEDAQEIYNYGINLGIAFQLQDDYLDIFGDENFGKQKAGDITENKKTYLFLKTLELADNNDKENILNLYSTKKYSTDKILTVTKLFKRYNVHQLINLEIQNYINKAIDSVDNISIEMSKKLVLKNFARELTERKV